MSESRIGAQLNAARLKQKLTIDQLHRASGVSVGCISEIEQGIVDPRFSTIQKLVAAMGLKRLSIQFK